MATAVAAAARVGVCDFLLAPVQWLAFLLIRLVLIVAGVPVVAVAVLFAVPGVSLSDGRGIVNVPRWAWLWGNNYDGLTGDKRGWWAEQCDALVLFGLLPLLRRLGLPVPQIRATGWLACWWWAAVRNPVNNMRLLPLASCPVARCWISYRGREVVEDRPGAGGFQFVKAAQMDSALRWYGLYWVLPWSSTRAFVLRLGFKIKPEHFGADEPAKGMTFKLNPCKDIA